MSTNNDSSTDTIHPPPFSISSAYYVEKALLMCCRRPLMYGTPAQLEAVAKNLVHIFLMLKYPAWRFEDTQLLWQAVLAKSWKTRGFAQEPELHSQLRYWRWGHRREAARRQVLASFGRLWESTPVGCDGNEGRCLSQWIEYLLTGPPVVEQPDEFEAVLYVLLALVNNDLANDSSALERFRDAYIKERKSAGGDQLRGLCDVGSDEEWEARGMPSYPEFSSHQSVVTGVKLVMEQIDCHRGPEQLKAQAHNALHDEPVQFPIGATLDGKRFEVTSRILSTRRRGLYFARSNTGGQYLVSVTDHQYLPRSELIEALSHSVPGIFPLRFVGRFDPIENDDFSWDRHIALVEELPAGGSARTSLPDAMDPRAAIPLAAGVGEILLRATRAGVFLCGVRPETVWVERRGELWYPTGLTDRHRRLPERVLSPHMSVDFCPPLFWRTYLAPEVLYRLEESDRAVTFTLALMLNEWLRGTYPFVDTYSMSWPCEHYRDERLRVGTLPALDVLLDDALQIEPARRPSLSEFIHALIAIHNRHLR